MHEVGTLSDVGFPDQVRDGRVIRGEGDTINRGILYIRNCFVSALAAPFHQKTSLRFQAAALTRLVGGKPLDSASIRSASS